jgi:AcrR family transcriptional regulator
MIPVVDKLVNSELISRHPEGPAEKEAAPAAAPRRRMSVAERERHILDGAIKFFAEHGLDAQMRELAAAIGVAHPLVYHYFPTKQALLERVYEEIFLGRWNPEWETLLENPELDLEDKLVRFYIEFAQTVQTREFVRILLFSGLSDRTITSRFFKVMGERLTPRLIRETRRFRGSRARGKPTTREFELLMGLHGGLFYNAIRWYVYEHNLAANPPAIDDERVIRDRVRSYLQASLTLDEDWLATKRK